MTGAGGEVSVGDSANLDYWFVSIGGAGVALRKGDQAGSKQSRLTTVWSRAAGSQNYAE